eukprot:CAMPEP_0197021036 /NCGR_PEP_ID=MMETSP1384-20130603/1928_1 /TAXON_ID=29189 /ORGANISM="Ammonia sp." /LENGTH=437 /DNA_ID=CAMNT_0042448783 /DNA_START=33 /DNA_END=1343 /DNA_ORIENTATION=-
MAAHLQSKATTVLHSLQSNFAKYMEHIRNSDVVHKTDLIYNERLSAKYGCNLFLKREDLQSVRSFKIRGAYCKIMENIEPGSTNNPIIVTASAGNHAQGVALTCKSLGLDNTIFVPVNTPNQKKHRIKHFASNGEAKIDSLNGINSVSAAMNGINGGTTGHRHNSRRFSLELAGENFDECLAAALEFCQANDGIFVHPFDDHDVIMGQSTVAQEIYEDLAKPDIIMNTVGGGGLISGVGLYSKFVNPECQIFGVEPNNANSLTLSMINKRITPVRNLDTFVDGASVIKCGVRNYEICVEHGIVDDVFCVSNEEICCDLLDLYENEGYILEPAGVMGLTALKHVANRYDIKHKNVVCILCGGNNDVSRYPEMIEKSLKYKGLKHYFLVNFPQTPGQLRKFVNCVLNEDDDITRFEYLKKNSKEFGTVLIGIQLGNKSN